MSRPRMLDLFCGAGGAAMGYHRAGFEVVGVDISPQPNYPFEFHQDDALKYLEENFARFDALHASPPCQGYSTITPNRSRYPKLISATREALACSGLPFVIENVQGARRHMAANSVRICGTGLGLPIWRHRIFESNENLEGVACQHARFTEKKYWTSFRPRGEHRLSTVVQVYGNGGGKEFWPAAMGINWMTWPELAESIPPAYTEFIGRQLLAHVGEAAA